MQFISVIAERPQNLRQHYFLIANSLEIQLVTKNRPPLSYVFRSPLDTLDTLSGVVQLTDCLADCRNNAACKAVNFETGLCVLLSSSATEKKNNFYASQFPLFTIYAEKICLKNINRKRCQNSWAFERVAGFQLRTEKRKKFTALSKEECLDSCLAEREFDCRSLQFDNTTKECQLSEFDRHVFPANQPKGYFAPSNTESDYYESNCVQEPKGLCEFKAIKGKVLKTVDSIHQEVRSVGECQQKCLNAEYRCFSYDFSDPSNGEVGVVCRTSHLDSNSLTHIDEPYLRKNSSTTFERMSCYNVSIFCRAKEMVAFVQTNKLFSGKIYAKAKPNSCVNDVTNSLAFEIAMPYNDLMCDVKQKDQGKFSSDVIIQHHDMVVTTKDLGLSVNCNYDLSNRSVSNKPFAVEGDFGAREEENTHTQTVDAPNIVMKITDLERRDISSAQVGDRLMLRVQIQDENSPYGIFVRELVAVDGVDASDIVLIDSVGCPTDTNIMGFVDKSKKDPKSIEIPFDAFKFPTSDVVQFRALVTPCIQDCNPVSCNIQNSDGKAQAVESFGKRRRRSVQKENFDDEVVVVQSIKIVDSFGFEGKEKLNAEENVTLFSDSNKKLNAFTSPCINVAGLTVACVIFLLIQLILVFIWAIQWHKRNRHFLKYEESAKSSSMQYSPTATLSTVPVSSTHRYSNFMKTQHE
ncbi:uncharacterized protein B4U80_05755 [Leptotrombidium deliense]|uniref:ZP domain-containing protein n=1 Tax=Leptotrombidium deliense TaxID=299467 RepID=A0A443SN48_9ACAR|nr:uncharacterized protein B4U80_05755 [Leptotrombidium deliense]